MLRNDFTLNPLCPFNPKWRRWQFYTMNMWEQEITYCLLFASRWLHIWHPCFLAHLSQRLTGWDYSIPIVCRPSVIVHTFKLEYLWSQMANLDHILWVSSLGCGKACISFVADWIKLWFPWQLKVLIDLQWGKRCLHLFSAAFDQIFWYLLVKRYWLKSRISSNFGQIGPLTKELAALEQLVTKAGIKARMSLISGRISLLNLELLALELNSTHSNLNISEVNWPIMIKFYV